MTELSQAERIAREEAAKAPGFGEPGRRRAWQAGRDYRRERERALVADPAVEVGGTTHAIWPDAERKAIAHADLYTTGGLLRALQNAIEEANAFESTPYNLRVLAARALVVARRRETQNQDPNHLDCSPSTVHKDH